MVVEKIITSLVAILIAVVCMFVVKFVIKKTTGLAKERVQLIYRTIILFILILLVLFVVSVWGVDPENIWIFFTSVLALVAIGFFAVWSILSNILAGIIFFFSKSVKIGDEIEVLPEGIRGRVKRITSIFTILENDEGERFHLPNNFLIQKVVKTFPKKKN